VLIMSYPETPCMDEAPSPPEIKASAASSESHYDLYLRAGRSMGFYFRNTNHGVTLTADRINWTFDGKPDGAPFANIRSVHLKTGGDWRNPISICTITFADGYKLIVLNAGSGAGVDEERRPIYGAFVRDLLARLAAAQTSTTFISGYRELGYLTMIAASIVLGVICIGVPLGVMIYHRTIGPIIMMFSGVALYWPLTKMIEKNAPRTYDPRNPPAALLE
jgi:hypothetical protein